MKAARTWVPERQDVIWIDCNPKRGQAMHDVHPFLVLSPKAFNERTSLVIGLPMATAACNASNPFAVAVGTAGGRKAGHTSYVLCHQPESLDWRQRGGAPHPAKRIPDVRFAEVLTILNQIVQLA